MERAPRRAAIALIAGALSASRLVHAQSADEWLGPDKALHAVVSANLAAGSYVIAGGLCPDPAPRVAFGAGVALTAGAAKELYDLTGRGTPSGVDFAWDLVGAVAGLTVVWAVDQLILAPARQTRATHHP